MIKVILYLAGFFTTMNMNTKSQVCLPVSVGDVVTVKFWNEAPKEAVVLEVERRYVIYSNGERMNPLVVARFKDSGKKQAFDNCFITKVLKRYAGPTLAPKNIFQKEI